MNRTVTDRLRRGMTAFMAVAIVAAFMPVTGLGDTVYADAANPTSITVENTTVTDLSTAKNIGKADYAPASGDEYATLTLNGDSLIGGIKVSGNIHIILKNENIISGGIKATDDLTITGETGSSLSVNDTDSQYGAIYANNISIKSGTIYALANNQARYAIYARNAITVSGGNVTAMAIDGIGIGASDFYLSGGTVIAKAKNNAYYAFTLNNSFNATGGAFYANSFNSKSGSLLSGNAKHPVIMTRKEGTTYTPTLTFTSQDAAPAAALSVASFPVAFTAVPPSNATFGDFSADGSYSWSATTPDVTVQNDGYDLGLNDITIIDADHNMKKAIAYDKPPTPLNVTLTGTSLIRECETGITNGNGSLILNGNGSLTVYALQSDINNVGIGAYGQGALIIINDDPVITVTAGPTGTSEYSRSTGLLGSLGIVVNGGTITAACGKAANTGAVWTDSVTYGNSYAHVVMAGANAGEAVVIADPAATDYRNYYVHIARASIPPTPTPIFPVIPADPKLTAANGNFDAASPTDLAIAKDDGGYTLESVVCGEHTLIRDKDYRIESGSLILTKDYLSGLTAGDYSITFKYSGGKSLVFSLSVKAAPVRTFKISVRQKTGGTVKVSKASAQAGDKINVTAQAKAGYRLKAILADGKAISGSTFTMPAENITVTGIFVKKASAAIRPVLRFSLKPYKDTIVVHWNTVKGAAGYQIANSATPNGKLKIQWTGINGNNTYTSISKLNGITYKFKMRYFTINKEGKRVYSKWTQIQNIKL